MELLFQLHQRDVRLILDTRSELVGIGKPPRLDAPLLAWNNFPRLPTTLQQPPDPGAAYAVLLGSFTGTKTCIAIRHNPGAKIG